MFNRGLETAFPIYDLIRSAVEVILSRMEYEVLIKRNVARGLRKLPSDVQKLLYLLVADLQADGPIQEGWRNFSPLGQDRYHWSATSRWL